MGKGWGWGAGGEENWNDIAEWIPHDSVNEIIGARARETEDDTKFCS